MQFTSSAPAARLLPIAAALLLGGALSTAHATNGYFSHGYGMKAKGMGGASVASTDNAFAGANNPAAAAWAGNRADLGVDVFMPTRSMERVGSQIGVDTSAVSGSSSFLVPEFGYNRALSDKLGVGIAVYGNGGMNTDYPGGQTTCPVQDVGLVPDLNPLCGQGRLGVDLMQLIVAPTVAYKVNDSHSFGVSPLLVYQVFKANGLQMFTQMSGVPGSVSNNGTDSSHGFGIRLGYLGKLNDQVTVGASYSPKISMSKFSSYAGLFADAGNFDIPANFTVGAALQVTPAVGLAFDYQQIKYSGVPSIANASSNQFPLGAANGPGFGWSDVNTVKLGVQWQYASNLVLRAGVNVGDNPIKARDVSFNIMAPGVTTTHYTAGATYTLSDKSEFTISYMYAPTRSVTGPSMFNAQAPNQGGTETIRMKQQAIGVQYGWKF